MIEYQKYKRLVTENELLYVRFNENYGQFNIQFIFEGQGRIALNELQKAIEQTAESNPIICGCLKDRYWAYSGNFPQIIEHKEPISQHELINSHLMQENMELDVKTVEVHVFNEGSMLLFKVFHGIMDGKGATNWVLNVFRALRGEELLRMNDVITEKDLVLSTGMNAPSLKLDFSFLPFKNYKSPYHGHFKWHTEKVDGRYPMLVSHICHFFTQNNELNRAKFMIPVDLRRHRKKLNSDCNLTLPIFLTTDKSMTAADIHGEYLFALKDNLELSIKNTEVPGIAIGGKFMADIGMMYLKFRQKVSKRFLATGIVSFLGTFNSEQFSTGEFKCKSFYALPSYQPLTPFNVIPIQLDNEVLLSIAYSNSLFTEIEIEKVIYDLKSYLLSLENKL